MKIIISALLLLLGACSTGTTSLPTTLQAASKAEKTSKKNTQATITDSIKNTTVSPGLISLYQKNGSGELLFRLNKQLLNKALLYFVQADNGINKVRTNKGIYREQKIVKFVRRLNHIEVVVPNTRFYIDPNNPLAKTNNANINDAIVASVKIISEDQNSILFSADDFLLKEKLHRVSKKRNNKQFLGKLDKSLTTYTQLKNYPNNTDIYTRYTYFNDEPKNKLGKSVADSRFISVHLQHAFIAMENNGYKPRQADPRIGFFSKEIEDLTSKSYTPFKDIIARWHLVKKNPELAISEPVKPIVWWLENTTPYEYRGIIKQAVLKWNKPLESAGFKNAIQVKIQPDDANWDAGDIRYNVLRWTSSPTPSFGGYGPRLSNPLTGEIIAADIMLEYSYITRRIRNATRYAQAQANTAHHCSLMFSMSDDLSFAESLATNKDKLLRQGLTHLVLHEIGHTLGLTHNMKASQLYDAKQIHNPELTQKTGITASVMDYPAVNVAPIGVKQGDYYSEEPGPYDYWAIKYGYSQYNSANEHTQLNKLLALSTKHQYQFGNDADDMRAAGIHIDPRIMTHDLTNDMVSYATDRIKLINHSFNHLLARNVNQGDNYQQLLVEFYALISHYKSMVRGVSRYIGGVYIERALFDQSSQLKPYRPTPAEVQLAALEFLTQYVFAVDTLSSTEQALPYLQPYRRGFTRKGKNEDPKIHDIILSVQKIALDHLLHKNVLKRINDSSLSLHFTLSAITKAIFNQHATKLSSQAKNLHIEYVNRLIKLIQTVNVDNNTKSAVFSQLTNIATLATSQQSGSTNSSHYQYINHLIQSALEQ